MNCNRITYDKNCNIIVHEEEFLSQYVYIYILQYNGSSLKCSQVIVSESPSDEIVFSTEYDGFYTLCTVAVSKNENFNYYYKDNKLFHYDKEIGLQDLINVRPEISGAKIKYTDYFLTCRLKNCYLKVCNEILENNDGNLGKCANFKLDKNLWYKKDLIQIAINTIEYLVEKGDFETAQVVLSRVVGCNGLCNNNDNGCGCNK